MAAQTTEPRIAKTFQGGSDSGPEGDYRVQYEPLLLRKRIATFAALSNGSVAQLERAPVLLTVRRRSESGRSH
jgi:hypothetical protein